MGSLKFFRYFQNESAMLERTNIADVLRNRSTENVQKSLLTLLQRSAIFVKLVGFNASNTTIDAFCCGCLPGNSSKIFKTAIC